MDSILLESEMEMDTFYLASFGSMAMLTVAPDPEFMVSDAIPYRNFISTPDDTHDELQLDLSIALLVDGLDSATGLACKHGRSHDIPLLRGFSS